MPVEDIPAKIGISNFSLANPDVCQIVENVDTSVEIIPPCGASLLSALMLGQPIVTLLSISPHAIRLIARNEEELLIADDLGRILRRSIISGNNNIDLTGFHPGLYFLHCGNLNLKFAVVQ